MRCHHSSHNIKAAYRLFMTLLQSEPTWRLFGKFGYTTIMLLLLSAKPSKLFTYFSPPCFRLIPTIFSRSSDFIS